MAELTLPRNAAEMAEFMADPANLGKLFDFEEPGDGRPGGMTAKPEFEQFMNDWAKSQAPTDAQIGSAVQAAMQEHGPAPARRTLGNGGGQGGPRNVQGPARFYNRNAPGIGVEKLFNGYPEFMQAIWAHAASLPNAAELSDKLGRARKLTNAMSSTIPSDGGFLIPEELRAEILSVALQESITRSRATVLPMASKTLGLPVVDETTRATTVRGGWVAYRTPESTAPTQSMPKFGRVVLDATKLMVTTAVPNELVADATGLASFIMQGLPETVRDFEERDFIAGSGVGEPLGWADADNPALISVTRNTDSFIWTDITAMFARMFASSHPDAVWTVSSEVLPALLRAVVSTGNATIPVVAPPLLLQDGQGIKAPVGTILGRPLLVSDHLPQSGSANDLMYVDLSYYVIGDRQGATMASSTDNRFQEDETVYKCILRNDGRPYLLSAITPPNGGDSHSAFVGRAA